MVGGAGVVRIVNPATGLPESTRSIEVGNIHAFLDLPGSAIAIVDSFDGVIRVRRILEATLATTHSAQLSAGRAYKLAITGPTGRIAVFTTAGSSYKATVLNGADLTAAHSEVNLPATVTNLRDAGLNNTNHLYTLGVSDGNWAAKFSATGTLLKQIVPDSAWGGLHTTNTGVWITGETSTRGKGSGPFASRYSK